MRLVTYETRGEVRAGVLAGDWVADLERSPRALPRSLRAVFEGGAESVSRVEAVHRETLQGLVGKQRAWEDTGRIHRLDQVRLWPPIPDPKKIICLGRNYQDHAAESNGPAPESPELFAKYNNTLIGHNWPILLPDVSDQVDYEAELAVVIGRRAFKLGEADALAYVAGYTIMHDVSARDYQAKTSQWLAGKSMDTFAPMGPWIVTADEVPDPQSLQIELRIGTELLQDANTSSMVHSVAAAIAYISSWMTLEPGDVIATGTPAGVGVARTPQRFLKPNDVVTISIERIGTLSNPVARRDRNVELETARYV